jgi:hypothetical protein
LLLNGWLLLLDIAFVLAHLAGEVVDLLAELLIELVLLLLSGRFLLVVLLYPRRADLVRGVLARPPIAGLR